MGELADKLQVDKLKKMEFINTINFLEVKNGTLEVKKFDTEFQGMTFTMGGSHSLTQNMNYRILAKIPKELIENNVAGQTLNKGLDFITKQAQNRGLNLESGDSYLVQIDLTGNVTKPETNFTILGTEEKDLKSFIDDKSEEIQKQIKDTIQNTIDEKKEELRDEAEETVDIVKDSVTKIVQQKVDTLTKTVVDTVKKVVEEKVSDAAKMSSMNSSKKKPRISLEKKLKRKKKKLKKQSKTGTLLKRRKKRKMANRLLLTAFLNSLVILGISQESTIELQLQNYAKDYLLIAHYGGEQLLVDDTLKVAEPGVYKMGCFSVGIWTIHHRFSRGKKVL